ncbi:hypothetical protein PC121_g17603 [Phytophthora cactorum]|nr:hypothetical protein PC120_g18499 [Phytophthora cactorum]KAG3051867.1 hypothetical protein PC121_g17603 [Phytophthora cactorum]
MLVGGAPDVLVIGVMVVLVFGIAPFRSTPPLCPQLVKFHNFLMTHEVLIAVYPFAKVWYAFAAANYQVNAMLLLLIWTFGANKSVGRPIREMEDYVPQLVAFNVDYFSTLFVSVCMYNSGFIQVSAVAILVDVVFTLMDFQDLRSNANHLYNLFRDHKRWSSSAKTTTTCSRS